MLNQSIKCVCVTRQNTQGWVWGQLCRDICLCAWGAKNKHAFVVMLNARLVDMVAIEWNVGLFSIC